jgi:hypothetical protein
MTKENDWVSTTTIGSMQHDVWYRITADDKEVVWIYKTFSTAADPPLLKIDPTPNPWLILLPILVLGMIVMLIIKWWE